MHVYLLAHLNTPILRYFQFRDHSGSSEPQQHSMLFAQGEGGEA
jgi:hypothetical protein